MSGMNFEEREVMGFLVFDETREYGIADVKSEKRRRMKTLAFIGEEGKSNRLWPVVPVRADSLGFHIQSRSAYLICLALVILFHAHHFIWQSRKTTSTRD